VIEYVVQPGTSATTLLRRSGILLFAILGYWTYVRFYEKRAVAELNVAPVGILVGTLSGAALISITTLSLFALGAYEVTAYRGLQSGLLGVAGFILIAAVLEEIVFRGVLFRVMEDAWGTISALWLSSLIFSVLHLGNFEADVSTLVLITTVVSATLISAFWTMVFVRSRNLWVVGTHHAAWNFAILLTGAPLSGLDEWRAVAPIESQYHGPTWLTGGAFGPEDSVITITVAGICLAALLYFCRTGLIKARLAPIDQDHHVPQSAMHRVLSPQKIAASLTEHWSPRVLAEVDESYVKVAKVQGTFGWHSHENEDELFLVLKGSLRIQMEAGPLDLVEGEFFVVPKGVRHNPSAQDECLLMLFEHKSILHTGSVVNENTRSLAEQLRPV
jgi:membrane protease YdiL (CAAX protease family)/mannose-6-phosphate isomerase-like protein (cupin superfamily)